jgi:hypothetical protein
VSLAAACRGLADAYDAPRPSVEDIRHSELVALGVAVDELLDGLGFPSSAESEQIIAAMLRLGRWARAVRARRQPILARKK